MLSAVNFNSKWIKLLLIIVLLAPLIIVSWQFYYDMLGANPIEAYTHSTGEWALRLLLATLAISPLRRIFRINGLIHIRRTLGLLAFVYATSHFVIYVLIDQWLDWFAIVDDIKERPYITVGFAAFVLLIPLAVTSTDAMQRHLQSRWVKLHKLIYIISILVILHFWWLVKADILEPAIYAAILAVLLGYRIFAQLK